MIPAKLACKHNPFFSARLFSSLYFESKGYILFCGDLAAITVNSCCLSNNQLQKYLRHCTVFWHKWPVHDLVLVIPPAPLFKVASNTRPYSKLGGTTLNGREKGGQYYILQTWTRSDLKQERSLFRGSVSTFLQLVVAMS